MAPPPPLPSLAASSLSTPSSHALSSPLPPPPKLTPPHLLPARYDLPSTLAFLRALSPAAKNVALQFPDELLGDSVEVFRAVQAELDRLGRGGRAWVLGDTTYGSCCVDSLSALHIGADVLVHYGHACLTPCADPALGGGKRIFYVFPRLELDLGACAAEMARLAVEQTAPAVAASSTSSSSTTHASDDDVDDEDRPKRGMLVVYEVGYDHLSRLLEQELDRQLKGKAREVVFSRIRLEGRTAAADKDDDDEGRAGRLLSKIEGLELAARDDVTGPACCRSSEPCSSSSIPPDHDAGAGSSSSSSCRAGPPPTSPSSSTTTSAPEPPPTTTGGASCCQPSIARGGGACCSATTSAEGVDGPASSGGCGGGGDGPCCSSRPAPTPAPISSSTSSPPSAPSSSAATSSSLRSYALPRGAKLADYLVFFIGREESLQLRNLLVTHSRNTVYSYSPPEEAQDDEATSPAPPPPIKAVLQSTRTNRLLMRRYAIMQKARDADVFGLLVGNVNLAGSLPLLHHLRSLLRKHHKKAYTVSVGKLNPAKLANFAEVECFVLVACGENTLVDSKEFYRPIITPYELELALQDEPQWGATEYVLDFTKLLPEGPGPTDEQPPLPVDAAAAAAAAAAAEVGGAAKDDSSEDDDQPIFSTTTGTYRHPKRYGATTTTTKSATHSTSLTLRSSDSALTHTNLPAPSELWKGRTWVGLDPRVGLDKVGVLEEGRGGRAWNYEEEKERGE